MGRNKIRKLLKEYRKQPKWYYHVTFDAIETGSYSTMMKNMPAE